MIPSRDKIFLAISSNKFIENMNPGWYDILNEHLSPETKQKVKSSNITLHALAIIIKKVMGEIDSNNDIDRVFNEKIDDKNLVDELNEKYKY